MNRVEQQRSLGRAGALLMLLSLLTGGFVSAAMTGKVPADAHSALASHLNALLGALWLFAIAWSLPLLELSEKQLSLLQVTAVLSNYANWAVTALKAFLKVAGVDYVGEPKNDLIFGLLTLFVVTPSLIASVLWCVGFFKKRSTP